MFLNFLKNDYNFEDFEYEKKFKSDISKWEINWEKIILAKPQTFMNLSWEALIQILNFFKIEKKGIIIISDDKDMDFWKIRFREKWSSGWHNWLKSIEKHIWNDYKRLKIWVWKNEKYETSDWVLSKFTEEEFKKLDEIFEKVKILLTDLL